MEGQGHTAGSAWTLSRVSLSAGWTNPWSPLIVKAETGRLGGGPTPFDQFHLGGVNSSLLPSTLDANRVAQAALPSYTALGNRLQDFRADLILGGFVTAYLEQATIWEDPAPRPAAQRVEGLEIDSRNLHLPMDILRRLVGNLSFSVGLHRPLDGAMKNRTVGTLSLILRP